MRIGIDLGGTNIAGGLVTDDGKLVYKSNAPTDCSRGEAGLIEDIISVIGDIIKNNAGVEIVSIGVGVPGHVDRDTQLVIYCNNIPFENTNLAGAIEKAFGIPAFIGNDANAAALGEVRAGAASNYRDAVMITLGTGVGAGLVFDNRVFSGCNGAAGEIGHLQAVADGIPCNCGRRGCFELYASATALKRQTREAMEQAPQSKLWELCDGNVENISGKTAFDAMRLGDDAGTAVVGQYIKYLAAGVTDIINLLQPDAVIFGGGISKEGNSLLEPLTEIVERERYSRGSKQTKLLIAELGNDAGIIGAALLGA